MTKVLNVKMINKDKKNFHLKDKINRMDQQNLRNNQRMFGVRNSPNGDTNTFIKKLLKSTIEHAGRFFKFGKLSVNKISSVL